jgi:hypothetical protein
MGDTKDNGPWVKVLLFIQLVLLAWIFNPWTEDPASIAIVIVAIELAVVVFWLFPVFLYHALVKRRPLRESFSRAAQSFVETLTFF